MVQYDWACKEGEFPNKDSKYFENMTRVIFQAGLNWKVITMKWPDFKEAFADFDIDKVTAFDDTDVARLMENKAIVRNEAKIKATILNAQVFHDIATTHGSFHTYLKNLLANQDLNQIMKTLQKQFNRLGKTSAHIYLWSVGVKVPHREH
ncbi:MAG: DNA-3-methyladenine glycosylase I [Promethearchaeota archaeon]